MAPRRPRAPVIDQLSGKQAIGLLFGGIMLACDFVEEIEKGRSLVEAGKRAKKKATRRTQALVQAEIESDEDDQLEEPTPNVHVHVKSSTREK